MDPHADLEIDDLQTDPWRGWTGVIRRLGERWWGVAAPAALLGGLLLRVLPDALQRAHAPRAAHAIRGAGRLALGGAGLDLALTAGLPLLRVSYAPVGSAFLYWFAGRSALAAAGSLLALAPVARR